MGRESACLVVLVTGRTLSPAVLLRGWPSAWGTAMGTGLWALRIYDNLDKDIDDMLTLYTKVTSRRDMKLRQINAGRRQEN